MKMYYIVHLPEKLGPAGYNKQFQCKSMFNGFTGPIRSSREEAEQDGEFHQRLLIAAYSGLITLCNSESKCEDSKSLNIVLNKEVEIYRPSVPSFNPKTVQIGNKLWMAENLAYDDGAEGIAYNPENNEYYYTWNAAKRVAKKLGWKLPSNEDWNKACEECGGIKNEYGDYNKCSLKEKLGIKLAGLYSKCLYDIDSYGYFWSSREYSGLSAWYRRFDSSLLVVDINNGKNCLVSVRLIKEIENSRSN